VHELYIAECILKSAREALPGGLSPASVVRIQVQVGQLDAVIPETLTFMFDAIKSSHEMPEAELDLEVIGVCCRCQDCSHEFSIDLPLFICPVCGGGNVEVLRGRGITLSRITAEDSDGNGCERGGDK